MRKFHLLLLVLLILTACQETENSPSPDENLKILDSLNLQLEQEKAVSDSLRAKIAIQDTVSGAYPLFFGKKYDGIEDPEDFIKSQLRNQPELIPLNPVLGGSMKFRKIDVISEKWLLAIYDDGHVQGKALMEYRLQPDGSIKYTVVATQEN